jgi:hypothetical protein
LADAQDLLFPLLSMDKTSKHLQYSVMAGLVTVFGLTIGFAGAATSTLPGAVQSFIMTSQNDVADGAFAGAKFDIAGLMSHPCYTITGTEVQSCQDEYGITEPLKTFLENGMILSYVTSRGLLPGQKVVAQPADTTVNVTVDTAPTPTAVTEPTTSTVTMTLAPGVTTLNASVDTEADFAALRLARSNKLWNICLRKDATREMASSCYQDNVRLLMRLNIDINEDTVQ